MKAQSSISSLPTGFDYYAGGHIHTPMRNISQNYAISYPGALFPNNFKELHYETPGFNFCSYEKTSKRMSIERYELNTYEKEYVFIDVDKLNPVEAKNRIVEKIEVVIFMGK